ncbi:MAG: sigma-70 family RNA polymerase sigma factor [Deltaproteobacteria bacterium]|nr:sigma-70 family RNA polymerase sigma factor [Deltaproteobacteria bacterium]
MGTNTLAFAQGQATADPLPDGPDREVIEAVRSGDNRRAVALCARLHGAALGRLCMAMVGSQAEAQELAQEALLAAHDAFPSYRGDGTVRAFLFGIARRVCSRHVEMRSRRDTKLRLVHDVGRDRADASDLLAAQQRASRARGALDRLRPTEREAVLLRFQSDLSFREVASACGVDEATARKRVSRAIARLRETLGDL